MTNVLKFSLSKKLLLRSIGKTLKFIVSLTLFEKKKKKPKLYYRHNKLHSQRHPAHPAASTIAVPPAAPQQGCSVKPSNGPSAVPTKGTNGHPHSIADGPWAHHCCWDVLHTQFHLSPKRSVGDTVRSLQTPAQQRAVCWRDGCLNIEELSNKC